MGCAHRCTFCFVRAFEGVPTGPSDDRYGTSIRVKTNLVEVLRRELTRRSWQREQVAVGTATDPYQPAEGRWRLTRGAIQALRRVRDAVRDHHPRPADRARHRRARRGRAHGRRSVTFSVPTLDHEIWRLTEPGTAPPRQRLRALRELVDHGIKASVGMAPILPGLSDRPGPPGRRREGGPRRGRDRRLGEPAVPRPARASTSSTTSRATGRSSSRPTSGCTRRAPTSARTSRARSRRASRACGSATASRTGAVRLEPDATPPDRRLRAGAGQLPLALGEVA